MRTNLNTKEPFPPPARAWVEGNAFIEILSIIVPIITTLGVLISSILVFTGTLNPYLYSKIALGFLVPSLVFTVLGLLTDRKANRRARAFLLITFLALTIFASCSVGQIFSPSYLPITLLSLKTFGLLSTFVIQCKK